MPDKKEVLNSMDLALVRRVALHYKDGVFEFELNGDEYTVTEGGTVYHVIPWYADEGAESVAVKLRRILARKLEEKE